MQTSTFVNNNMFQEHPAVFPLRSNPVCRVIMILHYAAVVILYWPKWLPEMHACDQSAVACWSSLFPDIVHWPQAPATDNGSLCQTVQGRISSRMLGVLCWIAAIKSCSLSWKCRVETKIWKGICYAVCVMETITSNSISDKKIPCSDCFFPVGVCFV